MNPQAQFWADFYAWSLALGFITVIALIIAFSCVWTSPWNIKRQQHRHEIKQMELRAKLTQKGVDPEYIAFLEKNLNKKQ
jgi:hypothetical protein